MFGFVKNVDGKVVPANRIFDTLLYNHFLSMDELQPSGMLSIHGKINKKLDTERRR